LGEAAVSPNRPLRAALPRENGPEVWHEMQNVSWSLADFGHEIHHVDRWSRYAAALTGFQAAVEDNVCPNAEVPANPTNKRTPAKTADV